MTEKPKLISHSDPVGFLREWRKPVVMNFMDYNGNEHEVVLQKNRLIQKIEKEGLSVIFRMRSDEVLVHLWKEDKE